MAADRWQKLLAAPEKFWKRIDTGLVDASLLVRSGVRFGPVGNVGMVYLALSDARDSGVSQSKDASWASCGQ